MKRISWYLIGFTIMGAGIGLGLSLLAAYAKASAFGGIEEETFAVYLVVSLIIFMPIGMILGKLFEKRIG